LIRAVNETLAEQGQAILFLNRRGYAPLTLCRDCGHRMQCPNCTTWLVEHR
jgi:primosomal protein N' (replication factor Y)